MDCLLFLKTATKRRQTHWALLRDFRIIVGNILLSLQLHYRIQEVLWKHVHTSIFSIMQFCDTSYWEKGQGVGDTYIVTRMQIWLVFHKTMARILKSRLTFVHLYSRNKSALTDLNFPRYVLQAIYQLKILNIMKSSIWQLKTWHILQLYFWNL